MHVKKISEVENWLISNVVGSNVISILLLTGPTGSGKTETVRALCKSLNIEISEWVNSPDSDGDDFYGIGQTAKFTNFLIESTRYQSLFQMSFKKIILIEEYPNSIVHNPTELEPVLK